MILVVNSMRAKTLQRRNRLLLCGSCKNKRDKNKEIQADIKGITSDKVEKNVAHKLWHRLLSNLEKEGYEITGKDRPETFGDLGGNV